jgi:chromosomal replication initiation ATPase DnaA
MADLEAARALVVEDVDRGISSERMLFHLLNLAREGGYSILLTSRAAPGEIEIGLPDLRSRLRALPLVRLEAPDEALLKGVLVKLFADRQLAIEPHVVAYIAVRMERSLEAAAKVVAAADRLSLALQRRVTRTVAAAALAAAAAGPIDGD